jgi:hypothetical protein
MRPVLSNCLTPVTFGAAAFTATLCLRGIAHRPSRARPTASYSPAVLRIPSWGLAPSRYLAPQCSHSARPLGVTHRRSTSCDAPHALPTPHLRFHADAAHRAPGFTSLMRTTTECTDPLSRLRSLHEVIHLVSDLYPKGYPQALGCYALPRLPLAGSSLSPA